MSKIGLFFGSSTGNCESVARMIAHSFRPLKVDIHDVIHSKKLILSDYSILIFGIPSWNKHYLQDDWHYFLPKINSIDFTDKRVALYGLGDQVNYADNFVDTMGRVYDWLTERKATIIGHWPVAGYHFRKSKAIRDGKFVGLVLDEDTQYQLTLSRVKIWVESLKKDFENTG